MKVQSVVTVYDSIDDPQTHEDKLNTELAALEKAGSKILKIDTMIAAQTRIGPALTTFIIYDE